MQSPKTMARVTGLFYFIIFVANMFAFFFVSEQLTVPGDAAATASNILASESLYRAGLVSYIVVFLSDLVVAVLLYQLLKPVSRTLSLLALVLRVTQTIIHGMNLLVYFLPLMILGGGEYMAVFDPAQLEALVLFFVNAHYYGVLISEAFFAAHALLLGYLVVKSDLFPAVLGVLLAIAGVAYFFDSVGIFMLPQHEGLIAEMIQLPVIVGEMSFMLYLIIKGVRSRPSPTATPSPSPAN